MALSSLSKTELIEEIRRTERRLGELEIVVSSKSARRVRSLKLWAGGLGTIAGTALAPPTGGLTLFVAGLGAVLWADGFREDAKIDNERRAAKAEQDRLLDYLLDLDTEWQMRGY